MKTKYTIIYSIVLVTILITAQSFYTNYTRKRAYVPLTSFRGYNKAVAFCATPYGAADSTMEISALTGWGNYQFKITTKSDSAQFYFNQGLSMYYAFHTIEAIASFTKATHLDPSSAMAWYGMALSMGPTINYPSGYRPPNDAYDASVKSNLLMGNCTALEKELIAAIVQRYSKDTTANVNQLRTNYATAMLKVYTKYPNDPDVITLYADALMLLHPWDLYEQDFRPKAWTKEIIALLEKGMSVSPKHPGANHYYIHTMEASAAPERANKSAHLLDTLMPSVSHIVHMPSHIYLRTGEFEQGIKNNDLAVKAYEKYTKQYAPIVNGIGFYHGHSIDLKIGCAQMAGNYQIASKAAYELKNMIPAVYLGMKGAEGNFVQYMVSEPGLTAVRFGKWDEALKSKAVDSLPFTSLLTHFTRGMAWSGKGDLKKARLELKLLNTKLTDTSLKAQMETFSTAYDAAMVAKLILEGVIADKGKQYAAAITSFNRAVIAEDKLTYGEPRAWPLPARQYLGKTLLNAGKYKDAIAVYNKDLVIYPNNGWTLNGLFQAYQKVRNSTAAAITKQKLTAAWKIKDLPITSSVF
jgi:tetratricopeptide (TPR) repeat protein